MSVTEVARALNMSQQGVSAIRTRPVTERALAMVQVLEDRVRTLGAPSSR
jgi:hypothetical protein